MKNRDRQPSARPTTRPAPGRPGAVRRDVPACTHDAESWFSFAAFREIVEALVIALILAFLFRTFEAEAFMIPTGSMATTLMGRHKDVTCARCACPYQISASTEVDPNTSRPRDIEVVTGTCPNCRFPMSIGPDNPQKRSYPSYWGDRLIVAKYLYQFSDPARWDVSVFLYPGGAKQPYIKRIVGLPEELIRIQYGNLYRVTSRDAAPEILRKPPDKILAMMQPVYDNDYVDPQLYGRVWPFRWNANSETPAGESDWRVAEDLRSFRVDGKASGETWLCYRHLSPTRSDWERVERLSDAPPQSPRAQLISDFVAYNTGNDRAVATAKRDRSLPADSIVLGAQGKANPAGPHWVGDLILECTADVQSEAGRFSLLLVRGGRLFRCEFDVASGEASFAIDGIKEFRPKAATKVRGPGKYRLRFANVDDQLVLWVDENVVAFDGPTVYGPLCNTRPNEEDLTPARIGSQGTAVEVSHVRVLRDVYYIATSDGIMLDYADRDNAAFAPAAATDASPADRFAAFLSDPSRWHAFDRMNSVEFKLEKDQFLMLGDNSAESKDSRLWAGEKHGPGVFYVDRRLLKGKAVFVYWPHSWDRVPGTTGAPGFPNGVPFPYFPNFSAVRFVH